MKNSHVVRPPKSDKPAKPVKVEKPKPVKEPKPPRQPHQPRPPRGHEGTPPGTGGPMPPATPMTEGAPGLGLGGLMANLVRPTRENVMALAAGLVPQRPMLPAREPSRWPGSTPQRPSVPPVHPSVFVDGFPPGYGPPISPALPRPVLPRAGGPDSLPLRSPFTR